MRAMNGVYKVSKTKGFSVSWGISVGRKFWRRRKTTKPLSGLMFSRFDVMGNW